MTNIISVLKNGLDRFVYLTYRIDSAIGQFFSVLLLSDENQDGSIVVVALFFAEEIENVQ